MAEGFRERFGSKFDEAMAALNGTAPLDIRSNPIKPKKNLSRGLRELEENIEKTVFSPIGYRLASKLNLNGNPLFREGYVEVQDEAAQLACYLVDLDSDMSVMDLCAGAGGKTLLLSALMKNKGQIFAFDTSAIVSKKQNRESIGLVVGTSKPRFCRERPMLEKAFCLGLLAK